MIFSIITKIITDYEINKTAKVSSLNQTQRKEISKNLKEIFKWVRILYTLKWYIEKDLCLKD